MQTGEGKNYYGSKKESSKEEGSEEDSEESSKEEDFKKTIVSYTKPRVCGVLCFMRPIVLLIFLRYTIGMKIDIKTTNLTLTDSISQFVEEKIGSLEKFIPEPLREGESADGRHMPVEAYVEIARTTNHHRQGEVYRAEVNLRIAGNVLRAEKEEWDIRVAVDAVREELRAMLEKQKGVYDAKVKKGARTLKRLTSISPLAWFRKER